MRKPGDFVREKTAASFREQEAVYLPADGPQQAYGSDGSPELDEPDPGYARHEVRDQTTIPEREKCICLHLHRASLFSAVRLADGQGARCCWFFVNGLRIRLTPVSAMRNHVKFKIGHRLLSLFVLVSVNKRSLVKNGVCRLWEALSDHRGNRSVDLFPFLDIWGDSGVYPRLKSRTAPDPFIYRGSFLKERPLDP